MDAPLAFNAPLDLLELLWAEAPVFTKHRHGLVSLHNGADVYVPRERLRQVQLAHLRYRARGS